VWETATGKKLQTFDNQAWIQSMAMSADGKLTLTGAGDRTLTLWETATGKKLRTFPLASGCVALSGDGSLYLTGALILRDTAEGKPLTTFQATPAGTKPLTTLVPKVLSVALAGDGKVALSGSDDGTATVWDATEGKKLQTFHAHPTPVTSVALSRDGRHALTGAENGIAIRWDTPGGIKLQGHTHTITSVALSDDGKHVWTTSADGTTRGWDLTTGKERCRLYTFDAGKDWLVVTPDGRFDGSEDAWRFVAHRVSGTLKLVEDEATRKRFHRPGLLAEIGKVPPKQ
jgi:WD40 repeat protein